MQEKLQLRLWFLIRLWLIRLWLIRLWLIRLWLIRLWLIRLWLIRLWLILRLDLILRFWHPCSLTFDPHPMPLVAVRHLLRLLSLVVRLLGRLLGRLPAGALARSLWHHAACHILNTQSSEYNQRVL